MKLIRTSSDEFLPSLSLDFFELLPFFSFSFDEDDFLSVLFFFSSSLLFRLFLRLVLTLARLSRKSSSASSASSPLALSSSSLSGFVRFGFYKHKNKIFFFVDYPTHYRSTLFLGGSYLYVHKYDIFSIFIFIFGSLCNYFLIIVNDLF